MMRYRGARRGTPHSTGARSLPQHRLGPCAGSAGVAAGRRSASMALVTLRSAVVRVVSAPRIIRVLVQLLMLFVTVLAASGCGSEEPETNTVPEHTESSPVRPWLEPIGEFEYLNNLEDVERRRQRRVPTGPPLRDPFRFESPRAAVEENRNPPVQSARPDATLDTVDVRPVHDLEDVPTVIGVLKAANDGSREFVVFKHRDVVYVAAEGGAFGDGYRVMRVEESTVSLERWRVGRVERVTVPR